MKSAKQARTAYNYQQVDPLAEAVVVSRNIKQDARQNSNVGQLFRRYRQEITASLYRRLGSREDADDIAQDTFVRYSAAAQRIPIKNPRAFLYRIARHLMIDHIRRSIKEQDMFSTHSDTDEIQDTAPSLEQQFINSREFEDFKAAVASLPSKCQQVFILRKIEGLSYAQIAQKMNISEAAVEKHVVRGLNLCRQSLGYEKNLSAHSRQGGKHNG